MTYRASSGVVASADENGTAVGPTRAARSQLPVPSVIVWGQVTSAGVKVEPAFRRVVVPTVASRSATNVVVFRTASGEEVARAPIDLLTVDHQPGAQHFAAAVAMPDAEMQRVATITLESGGRSLARRQSAASQAVGGGRGAVRGAAVRVVSDDGRTGLSDPAVRVTPRGRRVTVRWNRVQWPLVIVRDPATGQIRGMLRDGVAAIPSELARFDLVVRDGVHSRTERAASRRDPLR